MKTKFIKLYIEAEEVELPDEYDVWHHMDPDEVLRDIAIKRKIHQRAQEVMLFVAWGGDGQILAIQELNVGTNGGVSGGIREPFQAALLCNANSIGTLHNHPAGKAVPSSKDIERTGRMLEIASCLGIGFVEDLVIDYDGNIKSCVNEYYLQKDKKKENEK